MSGWPPPAREPDRERSHELNPPLDNLEDARWLTPRPSEPRPTPASDYGDEDSEW